MNRHELLFQKEVYAVVGCAIEVLNVRGHGLHENVYENCLCVEFRLRGIPFTQQERHQVLYKGELVGEYVPDLVVQQKLIVDTKTIDHITDHERGQMLNYLRITNSTRWDHPEFQTRAPGVGASRAKRRTDVGWE
jgi:GxxExxY protein